MPSRYRSELEAREALTPTVFLSFNGLNIASETTIWTPSSGKRFRLMGYHLAASVAGNIVLRDGVAGSVIAVIPSGAGGPGIFVDLHEGILSSGVDKVLTAQGPGSATLSGIVFGVEE